jgi:protocatechuate 3,4-dioxygenase beta subunit
VDFGNFLPPAAITGQKFDDRDGDGLQNADEPGLAGWTIELDAGADGTVDFTTTTDDRGLYAFTGLSAGTYRVREVLQSGWTQTTTNPADLVLADGDTALAIDFGNFQLITISGRKFVDLDGDGTDDGGTDPGLAGWTIELDIGADGSVDAATTTAADGTYSFADLGPGTYRVREQLQLGWIQTTADPADIVATSGSDVTADFGDFQLITISGRKFNDLDGDGADDGGSDPGLSGWTIELDANADGTVDATTTTAADGTYSFVDLEPGTYRVREQSQPEWVQTTADPADVAVSSGTNVTIDFGNFETITISGRKFEDLEGGGTDNDGSDPGLVGWTIFLDENLNEAFDDGELSVVTSADGTYEFTDLGPGLYRMREVLQAGWTQTTANSPDITATSGVNVALVDFGNFHRPTISGTKLEDILGDGFAPDPDADDTPLADWTIELFRDDGDGQFDPATDTLADGVMTDATGRYEFLNVTAGTYFIREIVEDGWIQTAGSSFYTVTVAATTSGETHSGNDFGNFETISITGFKIEDSNGNGVLDATDASQAGWTIFLDDNDNGTLDDGESSTTTADGSGAFNFTNVGPGTVRVREVLQSGWIQVAGDRDVTAQSGQDVTDVNFFNFELISIAGVKFEDQDGDGVRGRGEPGLAGWTIFLDSNDNGVLDDGESSALTSDDGTYSFSDLGPGTYRVREVLESGWVRVTANTVIEATSGVDETDVTVGNFQLITLSGQKFHDQDGDGTKDADETGVAGVVIFIDANGDGVLDDGELQTVTSDDGTYSLASVGPGTHRVREVLQSGWQQTTTNPIDIVAASGENASGVDFGNFQLITISGQKFEDADGDGVKDSGESGLAGWTIFLDTDGDGVLDTGETSTVTGSDGSYSFTNLGPGEYSVREVLQTGWTRTLPSSSESVVHIAESGRNPSDVDFGNFLLVTVSGFKFLDLNADGVFDFDEPGLPGWTIFLDANDNGSLDSDEPSAVTDDDGSFMISDVGPGTYQLAEVLTAGFRQTTDAISFTVTSGTNLTEQDIGNLAELTAQIIADPFDPEKTALMVAGSSASDRLSVSCGNRGAMFAQINGERSGPFEPTGHVLVFGYEGSDRLILERCVTLPAQLDGGEGDDLLIGGRAADDMLGGAGNDRMKGRGGDDSMDGSDGDDRMRGGRGPTRQRYHRRRGR